MGGFTLRPDGLLAKFTVTVTGALMTPNVVNSVLSSGKASVSPELKMALTVTEVPRAPLSGLARTIKYGPRPGVNGSVNMPETVVLPSGFVPAEQKPPVEVEQPR